MIGFAFAWVLGVAAAGVLAISALHLLSVRRPPELLLPTARFLPDRDVRAVSRTRRPSDVLLLLVRIAVLVTAGLAAAVPAWRNRAREQVTLVVADALVARDTAAMRALVQQGTGVASRVVFADTNTSARTGGGDGPAALMPVAWRAAAMLSRDAVVDSIDLHLLLSEAPEARDAGFAAWRAAWPGRITTHHAAAAAQPRRVVVVAADTVGTRSDDAVRAAFAWHAARASQGSATRVDTVALARGDGTAGIVAGSATSIVHVSWPQQGVPAGWQAGPARAGAGDSALALTVGGRALTGPFAVTAILVDTLATPIAWWSDGRVAATERRTPVGCERDVAVVSTPASDILLSASANALFDRLLASCEPRMPVSASTLVVADVHGTAPADAALFRGATSQGASAGSSAPWIVPMLFALSLLLLLAEWRLRTRAAGVA